MYFKVKLCYRVLGVFFSNVKYNKYTSKFKAICLDIWS